MIKAAAQSEEIKQDKWANEWILEFKRPVLWKKRAGAFVKRANALPEKGRPFYNTGLLITKIKLFIAFSTLIWFRNQLFIN